MSDETKRTPADSGDPRDQRSNGGAPARAEDPPVASLLSGELSDEEVELLFERSATNDTVSGRLDFVADLVAAVEIEAAESSGAPARRAGLGWRVVVPAVIAAAALLVWTLLPRTGLADLAEPGVPAYVAAELRAPRSPLAASFRAAMEGYAEGRFEAVEPALARFIEEHPEHAPAHFYRGAALAALGRLEEALGSYAAADAAADPARGAGYLRERARWRAANVQLLLEREADARALLEGLRAGGGDFALDAASLLERIDEL